MPRKPREPLSARQQAIALLARREHSQRDLVRKLASRGHDADAVSEAVETLAREGWQHDGRFADSLVRTRLAAGYGPLHIRAELATHGLDSEAVAAAMAEHCGEVDWVEQALDLLRRRAGGRLPRTQAERLKLANLLARRGFDGDTQRAALRQWAARGLPDDDGGDAPDDADIDAD